MGPQVLLGFCSVSQEPSGLMLKKCMVLLPLPPPQGYWKNAWHILLQMESFVMLLQDSSSQDHLKPLLCYDNSKKGPLHQLQQVSEQFPCSCTFRTNQFQGRPCPATAQDVVCDFRSTFCDKIHFSQGKFVKRSVSAVFLLLSFLLSLQENHIIGIHRTGKVLDIFSTIFTFRVDLGDLRAKVLPISQTVVLNSYLRCRLCNPFNIPPAT